MLWLAARAMNMMYTLSMLGIVWCTVWCVCVEDGMGFVYVRYGLLIVVYMLGLMGIVWYVYAWYGLLQLR